MEPISAGDPNIFQYMLRYHHINPVRMDICRSYNKVIIMVFNTLIEFFYPGPGIVFLSFYPESRIQSSRGCDVLTVLFGGSASTT